MTEIILSNISWDGFIVVVQALEQTLTNRWLWYHEATSAHRIPIVHVVLHCPWNTMDPRLSPNGANPSAKEQGEPHIPTQMSAVGGATCWGLRAHCCSPSWACMLPGCTYTIQHMDLQTPQPVPITTELVTRKGLKNLEWEETKECRKPWQKEEREHLQEVQLRSQRACQMDGMEDSKGTDTKTAASQLRSFLGICHLRESVLPPTHTSTLPTLPYLMGSL